MKTGPAGDVLLTLKSAERVPKSVARMRSPSTTARPSSRLPMYFRSRSPGLWPTAAKVRRLAGLAEALATSTTWSRPVPAFSRQRPSIWIRDWPRCSL